jgi:hypothetical protein
MKKITKKGIEALEKPIYTIETPGLKKYFAKFTPQYYNSGKNGINYLVYEFTDFVVVYLYAGKPMGTYFNADICDSVEFIIEHSSTICHGNEVYYRSEKFVNDLIHECILMLYIDPYKNEMDES